MFPVPDHLPKTGGDHISSEDSSDPTLDLLRPLLDGLRPAAGAKPGAPPPRLSSRDVQAVRGKLEGAIHANKTRAHELLRTNYPSVSSHIRLGDQVKNDFGRISTHLAGLEAEIDPTDQATSFLPPVLATLDRHFTAVHAQATAQAHVNAFQCVTEYVAKLQRLEEAIWAGRGADDWVLGELVGNWPLEGLEGTRLKGDIETRHGMLKAMVIEQLSDSFKSAIELSTGELRLTVHGKASLQQPKLAAITPRPSKPPPYSLSHIYSSLSRVESLEPLVHTLQTRIIREIVSPAASANVELQISQPDSTHQLSLNPTPSLLPPTERIDAVTAILAFVDHIYPPIPELASSRDAFISGINQAGMDRIIQDIILPAMPSSLGAIPEWLELVNHAVSVEASASGAKIIAPFFQSESGKTWAVQRRKRVAEDVRKIIVGGWGGWEALTEERDKDVVTLVEIEVSFDESDKGSEGGEHRGKVTSDEGFGWGFDETQETPAAEEMNQSDEPAEEGWGFDETENVAGPSQAVKTNGSHAGPSDGDGWDFEMASEPVALPIAKPAREAKRLGKKVAKVKVDVQEDPWAEEEASRAPEAEASSTDWSWGDTEESRIRVKKKRKVLKEEKKTIKETFLISRACEKVVDVAERILREASDLRQKDLLSPSFDMAYEILLAAATDVFDVYRSLLPTHFAAQVKDVPVLAMQLHNDARYMARRVVALEEQYPHWADTEGVLSQRLIALADHAFETQLNLQKESLMEGLEEARFDDVARDTGQKIAERALNGVVHKLDTLSRVLRVVLPATTYLIVLGYLLDETIEKISADILSLQDITEVESTRLSDLLKLIYPLEEIFVLEPGQPSTVVAQVPHWLKFCYISELLNASLVDILYLFDSSALIDFTTDELVNLVRALFADSEKRDKAIERIERGPQRAEVST